MFEKKIGKDKCNYDQKSFCYTTGAVNPCADAVCQNGGTCELVVNRSTLTVHSHCSCQIGFSGQYCEKCVLLHFFLHLVIIYYREKQVCCDIS